MTFHTLYVYNIILFLFIEYKKSLWTLMSMWIKNGGELWFISMWFEHKKMHSCNWKITQFLFHRKSHTIIFRSESNLIVHWSNRKGIFVPSRFFLIYFFFFFKNVDLKSYLHLLYFLLLSLLLLSLYLYFYLR